MVKSKKMSKSAVAIIVLALLLVLSMVLGLTGAWFTDKISGGAQSELAFGKVELGQSSAMSITTSRDTTVSSKTVDGDSWTIAGSTFSNSSDVAVYYYYKYVVELYEANGTTLVADSAVFSHVIDEAAEATTKNVRASFSASDSGSAFRTIEKVGFLAGNETTPTEFPDNESSYVITFNSEGTANFDAGDPSYVIKVTLSVKAVQARNITSASVLAEQLGYESYAASQAEGTISYDIDQLINDHSGVEKVGA